MFAKDGQFRRRVFVFSAPKSKTAVGIDDVYFVNAEDDHVLCCSRYIGVNTAALFSFSGYAHIGWIFCTLSAKAKVLRPRSVRQRS